MAGAQRMRRLGSCPGRHRRLSLLATLGGLVLLAIAPSVGAAAPLGDVTEFSTGLNAGAFPAAITAGVDGKVWFSDRQGAVGQATTSGMLSEVSSGLNAGASLRVIAQGPDGNFWFADGGAQSGNRPDHAGGGDHGVRPPRRELAGRRRRRTRRQRVVHGSGHEPRLRPGDGRRDDHDVPRPEPGRESTRGHGGLRTGTSGSPTPARLPRSAGSRSGARPR